MTTDTKISRSPSKMREVVVIAASAVAATILTIIHESLVNAFGSEIGTLVIQVVSVIARYIGPYSMVWFIIFLSILGAIFLVVSPLVILHFIKLHAMVSTHNTKKDQYNLFLKVVSAVLTRLVSLDFLSTDQEEQKHKILEEILGYSVAYFNGAANSAVVLLPDDTIEYLRYHTLYRMDNGRMQENMHFYIGHDISKIKERGVAGTVYHSRKAMVGHMNEMSGKWVCDLDFYREHEDSIMGQHPLYQSFICVPIKSVTAEDTSACLGVIWMDGKEKKVFDADDVEIVLNELARYMAIVIVMCDKYRKTGLQKANRKPLFKPSWLVFDTSR